MPCNGNIKKIQNYICFSCSSQNNFYWWLVQLLQIKYVSDSVAYFFSMTKLLNRQSFAFKEVKNSGELNTLLPLYCKEHLESICFKWGAWFTLWMLIAMFTTLLGEFFFSIPQLPSFILFLLVQNAKGPFVLNKWMHYVFCMPFVPF